MQGKYAVLMGQDSPKLEQIAASDLGKYLSKMTNVEVSLIKDTVNLSELPQDKIFVVGTPETNCLIDKLVKGGAIDLSEKLLGSQGFRVKTVEVEDKDVVLLAGFKSIGSMYAVYDFLENYCDVGFFLEGDRIPSKNQLIIGTIDQIRKPKAEFRIFATHPYWSEPYIESCRLWSFEEWRRLIDWMRKKRFNVLPLFHDEGTRLWGDVVFKAFPEIKEDETKYRKYVVIPEYRTQLTRKIIEYCREQGINIAYNFFYSQVPDFFQEDFPDLIYHKVNMDSLNICASQGECKKIIGRYWRKIIETYGMDDSHLYLICPYQHEKPLCDEFPNRAKPALQAYQILKEIDPKANIFIETWCWGFDKRIEPQEEWRAFLEATPAEVGVIDWDSRYAEKRDFNWYVPRKWIQLAHITLEGAYPPACGLISPSELIEVFRRALDHGSSGLAAFNIMGDGNEYLSALSADLGWGPDLKEEEFLEKYVKLRFGESSLFNMLKSFGYYLDCIDKAVLMVGFDVFGRRHSGEADLKANVINGNEGISWIKEKLGEFHEKHSLARKAMEFAQKERDNQRGNLLYDSYLWELEYVLARWEGVISLYDSHRYSATINAGESKKAFQNALYALQKVKKLYENKAGYSMNALQEMAKDVKYNPYFLENWRNYEERGSFWKPMIARMHVVWERFDEYESFLRELEPVQ